VAPVRDIALHLRLVSGTDGAHASAFQSAISVLDPKKSTPVRRRWRAAPPPFIEVDFDPTQADAGDFTPKVVLDPVPAVDWRSSSYDLLNGTEVSDQSDSIPGELFDQLFRSAAPAPAPARPDTEADAEREPDSGAPKTG
jgi:hypothetical protein